jgi:hypothetical protein
MAGTGALNCRRSLLSGVTAERERTELAEFVRRRAGTVEAALVERDREALADAPGGPDAVVEGLFPDAFLAEHTDFPTFEAFLESAGAESVWALSRWLDWVLDWHVLGNTRFWSWEWMVNAAVELGREAAAVAPVRCRACGGRPVPATGSPVEEPGRVDETWLRFDCDCGRTGRVSVVRPEGEVRTTGDVAVVRSGGGPSRTASDVGERRE